MRLMLIGLLIFISSTLSAASPRESALKLAHHFQSLNPPQSLKWDWADAVFLYATTKYPELSPYLKSYHRKWARRSVPRIDRSDRCAPALSALNLPEASPQMEKVMDYIRHEPRNRLGTIDHLGHSWFSWFYPSSIWIDSLMMYAVLAVKWGVQNDDQQMIEFGSSQPMKFASVLLDPQSGLMVHAYSFLSRRTIPRSKTFWLRGNGWAITSIAEMLEALNGKPGYAKRRRELSTLLVKMSKGLLKHQKKNGAWETVINRRNYSYNETSGALLVAYGWAKAYRLGYLPKKYLIQARLAFEYAETHLKKSTHRLSLGGISSPTNPGPAWAYRLIRRKRNLPYGVGAYLLAAHELESLK